MRRFLLVLFAALFLCISPKHVWADEGWIINDFHSDIDVLITGDVRVDETITLNFGNLEKHGIYRDIPYVYDDSGGKKIYTDISVDRVTQDGEPVRYDVSRNDGYVRVKIGDPNRTITGAHTYAIRYDARGVLRSFSDHDELYWNTTGNAWPVMIQQVSTTVTLPKKGLTKAACYQGPSGSETPCDAAVTNAKTATFETNGSLSEGQGMTIVAGFTKGLVPILTVQKPKTFLEKVLTWPSLVTLLISLIAGVWTILLLWYSRGRDYWFGENIFYNKDALGTLKPVGAHETVSVEFTPPDDLRPAEIGVLMDERADTRDVVATIIDLATRGYLTITEIPKAWMFGKVDYTLEKQKKDTASLLSYEKLLLDKLFKDGDSITVSSLKTTFYEALDEVKAALYKDVVAKKLFPANPEEVRMNYTAIGAVLSIIGGASLIWFINQEYILASDLALAILISGLLTLLIARIMPRRSAYGRDLYRRVRGYYLFVNTSEKYRQRFFEKRNLFNEVLPYAIVFGLTGKFAQAMKDIGLNYVQTSWYHGSTPFVFSTFGRQMDDFTNSMSGAIASAPKSSGFSGGSSGGGFGGGGGGSW